MSDAASLALDALAAALAPRLLVLLRPMLQAPVGDAAALADESEITAALARAGYVLDPTGYVLDPVLPSSGGTVERRHLPHEDPIRHKAAKALPIARERSRSCRSA